MSGLQEAFAVLVPLVVLFVGVLSVRAWRRDRQPLQLAGGALAILYAPITILNLSLAGNLCGDFLFAEIGYVPRSAIVDVIGKGCLLCATLAWGFHACNQAPTEQGASSSLH